MMETGKVITDVFDKKIAKHYQIGNVLRRMLWCNCMRGDRYATAR